ncbi:hypothetical protein VTP01DRAFT_3668, partial [Rhizomucor pusillus]|uniref:uncharacterized protein n=1 Tax=Rhizomucor pusillus TaxID=4840 RepID=UPI0037420D01
MSPNSKLERVEWLCQGSSKVFYVLLRHISEIHKKFRHAFGSPWLENVRTSKTEESGQDTNVDKENANMDDSSKDHASKHLPPPPLDFDWIRSCLPNSAVGCQSPTVLMTQRLTFLTSTSAASTMLQKESPTGVWKSPIPDASTTTQADTQTDGDGFIQHIKVTTCEAPYINPPQ